MARDKELKKEIRSLLTGRTYRNDDGLLVALPEDARFVYRGVSDNMGRKTYSRSAELVASEDPEEAFHAVLNALQQMGILVDMRSQPDALCALKRYFLTKAVLICVTPERGDKVYVEVYTGKSFFAPLCCVLAIKRLKRLLEDE